MRITRWGIYRANLDPVIGSEQGKTRPVIIISDDRINQLLNIVNILPITSRKEGRIIYPNEVLLIADKFGLPNDSVVLCHQIRTLDKRRLSLKYGEVVDEVIKDKILAALCFQLGITGI